MSLHTFVNKMANAAGSSTQIEDFDSFFDGINLEEDEEFLQEVERVIKEAEAAVPKRFKCQSCDKVCKTKQGLTRHKNSKHSAKTIVQRSPEDLLPPETFQKFINESAIKLSNDECYSKSTQEAFSGFSFTLIETGNLFSFVKDIIKDFNGDGEKFYPLFYKAVIDNNIFPSLSTKCSRLLGFDVANKVLAHLLTSLSSSSSSQPTQSSDHGYLCSSLTEKQLNIVTYLSGYVFSTLYKRLRFSASRKKSEYTEKYLSFLLCGKVTEEDSVPLHVYEKWLEAKDRGGLWRVDNKVFQIFEQAELYFQHSVMGKHQTRIVTSEIVAVLQTNSKISAAFKNLCGQCPDKIETELGMNMLEDLLNLYIRVRTFSYVNQKRELFKLESKKKKMNSLRKSLKKVSSTREMGH